MSALMRALGRVTRILLLGEALVGLVVICLFGRQEASTSHGGFEGYIEVEIALLLVAVGVVARAGLTALRPRPFSWTLALFLQGGILMLMT